MFLTGVSCESPDFNVFLDDLLLVAPVVFVFDSPRVDVGNVIEPIEILCRSAILTISRTVCAWSLSCGTILLEISASGLYFCTSFWRGRVNFVLVRAS